MNEPLTSESYTQVCGDLQAAAGAYYAGASPLMDDATYDAALRQVVQYEEDNGLEPGSVTSQVAAGSLSGGTVEHTVPMLSLENVFNQAELEVWFAKVGSPSVTVEPKLDGLAICITYVGGKLVTVATRGDGTTGEDISHHKDALAAPAELPSPFTGDIRGEAFLGDGAFEVANDHRVGEGKGLFANPRNAVAGTLNRKEPAAFPVDFVCYDVVTEVPEGDHLSRLATAAEWGFSTTLTLGGSVADTVEDVVAAVQQFSDDRATLGYGIDGAVIKATDNAVRDALGSGSKAPKWATAYKYPADTVMTRVQNIDLQVGRSGVITPVARVEAVEVGGVVVTNATLSNPLEVERKDVRIGDQVWIQRAGDVIPEITGPNVELRTGAEVVWELPVSCPDCDTEIDRSQRRWRCGNGDCPSRLDRWLEFFVGDHCLDIDGVGKSLTDRLLGAGLITDPAGLYEVTFEQLLELDGIKETSARNAITAIEASKAQPLWRVLTGSNIRTLGRSLSRIVVNHFGSLDAILEAPVEEFESLNKIGSIKAEYIHAGLQRQAEFLRKLQDLGVGTVEDTADEADAGAKPLVGLKVVVTGSFDGIKRSDVTDMVIAAGGDTGSSVSKNTSYLIAGEKAGSKLAKAESLGVPVVGSFEELVSVVSA